MTKEDTEQNKKQKETKKDKPFGASYKTNEWKKIKAIQKKMR